MDVALELIDHATGEVFAQSEVPLDSLPRRFAGMDTQLTVGDKVYRVVAANPDTREDIAQAKRVVLRLQLVETVDPQTVLYSLPTIEDAIAPLTAGDHAAAILIAPDDWRQVEFVRAMHRAAVLAEFTEIGRIKREHQQGSGFDAIHVRKGVPEPLRGARLRRVELEQAIGAAAKPLALRGQKGVVAGGFAIPDTEAMVYGLAQDGEVVVMGLFGYFADTIGKLHALALARGLVFVDWCGEQCLVAHEQGFVQP